MTLPPTAPRPGESSSPPARARTHPAQAGTLSAQDATLAASDAALATHEAELAASAAHPVPPFEQVLAAHEAELYRYLRRLTPTADDAADLLQDTCVRAFRAYPRLAAGANVRAWLYRIAGNLARDAHRRRRVRAVDADGVPDATQGWHGASAEAPGGDPAGHVAAAELREAVRAALLELSARQRVAVVRRVLEERPYEDVAAALGCSDVTARQHVSQGLRRLRALLAPWMEVDG